MKKIDEKQREFIKNTLKEASKFGIITHMKVSDGGLVRSKVEFDNSSSDDEIDGEYCEYLPKEEKHPTFDDVWSYIAASNTDADGRFRIYKKEGILFTHWYGKVTFPEYPRNDNWYGTLMLERMVPGHIMNQWILTEIAKIKFSKGSVELTTRIFSDWQPEIYRLNQRIDEIELNERFRKEFDTYGCAVIDVLYQMGKTFIEGKMVDMNMRPEDTEQ